MKYIIKCIFLFASIALYADPLYFCTAADSKYFSHLLNLIGSIHKVNYEDLGEIAVFNIGMTRDQVDALLEIEKVTVHEVEKVHPDILTPFKTTPGGKFVPGWYAWKWVAIKQALDRFPYVVWIDAGSTVLRPLNILFKHIQQHGYFLCTIGMPGTKYSPVGWGATKYLIDTFDLNNPERQWILAKDSAMGGIVGVAAACKDLFIMPLYDLAHELRAFADDGTAVDGFGNARHDQPLLSAVSYLKDLTIFSQDETQKQPIFLTINKYNYPFYITWDSRYINDQTNIYSSREDLRNLQYYKSHIHYKQSELTLEENRHLSDFAKLAYSTEATVHNSYILAQECIKNNISGDFIECGVAAGAQVAAMAYASKKHNGHKTIYLCDSFEGVSLAGPHDYQQPGIDISEEQQLPFIGVTATSIATVAQNLCLWGMSTERLLCCKGLFQNTISQLRNNIDSLSLLRIDGDFYSETRICIDYLYPKVSKGGYVIIGDYTTIGCRKAADDYIRIHKLNPKIIRVKDSNAVYWQIDDECVATHSSSYPYIAGDTFRVACDHHVDLGGSILNPALIKTGDTVYVHGDVLGSFFATVHPHIKNKYILVTHNSDYSMPGAFESYLDDEKISAWFALNPGKVHPKLKPLPIGHANKFCPSGVTQIIDRYAQAPWKLHDEKQELLYMNFKVCNNRVKRQPVQDFFTKMGICKQAESKPFGEFLEDMSRYKFVLSPEGAGPDCHRTWEALLVGCIPIVVSSPLDVLFEDLPVLIVNSWEEVTPRFLDQKYKEIMGKQYNRNKLYADYWLNKIVTEKKNVIS